MAETVGALILTALSSAGVSGIAGTTILGVTIETIVGTAAIVGASIGLNAALRARPQDVPPPESGSQALKQAIPVRIMGYGRNRLAGYYVLYESFEGSSYDIQAFHSGRVSAIVGYYLHDDPCTLSGGYIVGPGDGRYGDNVINIETRLGTAPQAATAFIGISVGLAAIWSAAHQGNGVAWAAMRCGGVSLEAYSIVYPRQKPELSLVVDCAPIWDPRRPQQFGDPNSWQNSTNPVIQLIDYIKRDDGGLGLDYFTVIAPRLNEWMAEAALCDELVFRPGGAEPRYASNGWFRFDNNPEDVINSILATCDGWLAESGDGTLSLKVGVYREPTVTLTEKHIIGFALNYGEPDEQTINQLDISHTDPSQHYVQVQIDSLRDEEAISRTGTVRAQQLNLPWVHSPYQAGRLAERAMARINPDMSGSFVTTLSGLRALGERWVRLQYPFVSGLQDAVVEIQGTEVDLLAGRVTFNFVRLPVTAIEPYEPADETVPDLPPVPLRERMNFGDEINSGLLALLEDV